MSIDTSTWLAAIEAVETPEQLEVIEQQLFGRKDGVITVAMKALKDIDPTIRKQTAGVLNEQKRELVEAIEAKKADVQVPNNEYLQKNEKLDIDLQTPGTRRGYAHLIPEFIAKIEEIFGRMGFDTYYGPELETEAMNFDTLNIPDTHAARDGHDTFWVQNTHENDGQKYLLRTQTSPCQIRYMQENTPPFRAIFPGKVYRKDADATHSPMFHQFEGLMIGKDVNLANMKAVMTTAIRELINQDGEFRFRTGYFPFVEPGLEVDMRWQGDDSVSREGKWLEIVGCGMVHPNVLQNVNIDPTAFQGFAFGFGIERMIMIKHQIPDLRSFYEGKPEFLRQF